MRRYELGETDTTQKPTIADWRDKFLNDSEARNLSRETIRKYKLLFSQLEQFASVKKHCKNKGNFMEARVGIEPTHKGFADLSLTTWVPRRQLLSI